MKYLIIILLLCSCSARWHVRQAEKHLRKAEFKGAQVKYDTVFVHDTIVTQHVTVDTVFKSSVGDTVLIEKEKLKIKYVRLPGDSVFIEGECKPDTIIREIPVTITKEIKAPTPMINILIWIIIIIVLGAILLNHQFRRK